MKLAEFTDGDIYVDTNVLYMFLRSDPQVRPVLKMLFRRIAEGRINAVVGVPVVDELYYRLLLAFVRDKSQGHPLDVLRSSLVQTITEHAPAIQQAVHGLLTLPNLRLVGVDPIDIDRMYANIVNYALLPRDALHLAIMQRSGLTAMASDDRDFDRVPRMTRHWLVNPPADSDE